jgi:hypothetical protein
MINMAPQIACSEFFQSCYDALEPCEICGLLQACSELVSLPQTLFTSLATLIGVGSVCPLCGCVVIPLGTVISLCGYAGFGVPAMLISLVGSACTLPRSLCLACGELCDAIPALFEGLGGAGGTCCEGCPLGSICEGCSL